MSNASPYPSRHSTCACGNDKTRGARQCWECVQRGGWQRPLDEAFWSQIRKTATCWLWEGRTFGRGYGWVSRGWRRSWYAHRLSWMLARGPIPEGLLVLHKCDVKRCVNPDHLYLGTNADNSRDMVERGALNRGSRNGQAKLTEERVRAIKAALSRGESQASLARQMGVTQSVVSDIARGRSWTHV